MGRCGAAHELVDELDEDRARAEQALARRAAGDRGGGDRVCRLGVGGALPWPMRSPALPSSPAPPCSRSAPAKTQDARRSRSPFPSAATICSRAVVAGLPDPVIALDRDGRVLALNERARALAPALRQGEPVSFALRMPELIEAIGRASAQRRRAAGRVFRARAARPLVRDDRDAGQARAERGASPILCC